MPVDDLAVHEPDYKHLIAFLKAMEFTTLTRRVAEKSGIEAGEIEAECQAGVARGIAIASAAAAAGSGDLYGGSRRSPTAPPAGGASPPPKRPGAPPSKATSRPPRSRPRALAAAQREQVRPRASTRPCARSTG